MSVLLGLSSYPKNKGTGKQEACKGAKWCSEYAPQFATSRTDLRDEEIRGVPRTLIAQAFQVMLKLYTQT